MRKIEPSDAWKWWFAREKKINSFKNELEAIERCMYLEKKYPTKGDQWYKESVKKRMILRYKIKSLEGVVE